MSKAIKNGYVLSVAGAILLGSVLGYVIFGNQGSKSAATVRRGHHIVEISLRRGIYPPLGVALQQPTSWVTSSRTALLALASPDAGAASVTFADLAGPGNDAKLRPQLNSQLVRTFQPAKVIGERHGPIGKVAALTTAILGTSRNKRKVLILSTAVSSSFRTYSIQVLFKSLHPSEQSLLEVRNMLSSVRFFAPQG